jgi:pimeloyl-ACP methyl ester carboxylesterase
VLAHSDSGSGPALVLLHGIGADRHRWDPLLPHLTGFRCVAVDLPGHGESPDDGCDLVAISGLLTDLAAHLQLGPYVVVGHSLGANAALMHAALGSPRAVVAVDPGYLHLPDLADSLAPFADRLRGDDVDAAFEEWESRFGAPPGRARTARQEVVLAYWSALLRREDAEARQPLFEGALRAIAVPVLVCAAQQPSPTDAAVLASMPTTTVEVFDRLGHFLHLAAPERFAARLRAFVSAG